MVVYRMVKAVIVLAGSAVPAGQPTPGRLLLISYCSFHLICDAFLDAAHGPLGCVRKQGGSAQDVGL